MAICIAYLVYMQMSAEAWARGDGRRTEAFPQREHCDLAFGPLSVDIVNELDVACGELGRGDVADWVEVVGAEVDDDDVCSMVLVKVPTGWALYMTTVSKKPDFS